MTTLAQILIKLLYMRCGTRWHFTLHFFGIYGDALIMVRTRGGKQKRRIWSPSCKRAHVWFGMPHPILLNISSPRTHLTKIPFSWIPPPNLLSSTSLSYNPRKSPLLFLLSFVILFSIRSSGALQLDFMPFGSIAMQTLVLCCCYCYYCCTVQRWRQSHRQREKERVREDGGGEKKAQRWDFCETRQLESVYVPAGDGTQLGNAEWK